MYFLNRRPPHNHGFTLLEILLAIGILALIALMIAGTLSSTIHIMDFIHQDGERDHIARTTLELLATDLTMGRIFPKFPWIGKNGVHHAHPADVVAFTTMAQPPTHSLPTEPMPTRIVYAREGGTLVRFSTSNVYGITDESTRREEIAQGVSGFNLRYFDPRTRRWIDEWNSQVQGYAPTTVVIDLILHTQGRQDRRFTGWVTIPFGGA